MEAFGRVLAFFLGSIGLVFLLCFNKTASLRWQRAETVRNICYAYMEDILNEKVVSRNGWEAFCRELRRLGDYRPEINVYERKRFEGKNGRVYLFAEWEAKEEDKLLAEGSYVRIKVTEKMKNKFVEFFYGAGCTFFAGGRVN